MLGGSADMPLLDPSHGGESQQFKTKVAAVKSVPRDRLCSPAAMSTATRLFALVLLSGLSRASLESKQNIGLPYQWGRVATRFVSLRKPSLQVDYSLSTLR